jgi:hypothetical protein
MTSRTFRVYSDPGHAWIKVSKAFLERIIGKDWRKVFTPFSYERGDYVYLEEDEDASRFVNWCRANSIEPIFKDASTGAATKRSRIRTYAPLSPC